VENLTLTGTAAIEGYGNETGNNMAGNGAANFMSGGDGNDAINGLTGNDSLFGDGGSDLLTGGLGNDDLHGGDGIDELRGEAGNDVLEGGGGADMFVFNSALSATTNVDQILDFTSALDTIRLSKAVFKALTGPDFLELNENAFRLGTAAADADDRIIYDIETGNLFYDANGSAAGGSVLFARLGTGGVTLASDDIIVTT
jgi:Ca2+-binding RTX toxin-like protein